MLTFKITRGLEQNQEAIDIRQSVFVEEQGFIVEFDDIDGIADHVTIFKDEVPAATGRIFPKSGEEDVYIIGRVAVLKEFRGQNLGFEIVKALQDVAVKDEVSRIELSAQVQAKGLYEKLGYVSEGESYLDEHCPHIKMVKRLDQDAKKTAV